MGYSCSYGVCTSRIKSLKFNVRGAQAHSVFFVKFPYLKNDLENCKKWVSACGRKNFTIENVDNSSYICSRHFHGFQGPTKENPNPIPLFEVLTLVTTAAFSTKHTSPQKQIFKRPSFESGNKSPIVNKRICPRELGLTPADIAETLTPLKNQASITKLVISDLCPPKGWSLEMHDEGFTFAKHQNNYKVIELLLKTSEATSTYPVVVKVLDKKFNPEKICPNFTIKTAKDIYIFLQKFDNFCICPGNNENDFVALYKQSRKPPFYSTAKSYFCSKLDTIYSRSCLGLYKKSARSSRCHECSQYRCTLRMMKLRNVKRSKNLKTSISTKVKKAKIIISKCKENLFRLKQYRSDIETMIHICSSIK